MAANHQPLPAGWEAKWDPGQQRYFFIDHSTKKTSWQDPRLTQPAPSNAFTQQQQASSHHGTSSKTEHIPMQTLSSGQAKPKWQQAESTFATSGDHDAKMAKLQKMFPTAPSWKITNVLHRFGNDMGRIVQELESSGYHQQDLQSQRVEEAIVKKLNHEFASAEVGVIRDIVQCFDNNEERARSELKALGYSSVKDKPAASSGRSSPKKSASPARATSPKEPSDAEKKRMKSQLAAEFPDYSESMIDIALGSCQFKVDRARTIINTMMKQRAKQSDSSSPAKTRTRSPSPATPLSPSSSSTSRSRTPDFNVTFPDTGMKFTFPTSSTSTSSHAKETKTSQAQKRQPPIGSAASRLSKSPKKGPKCKQTTRTTVLKTATTPSTYVSPNQTKATGPNHELAKGPDKDLLIDDYQPYIGPNRDIHQGPDKANVVGASGNFGADASLRQGPDADAHEGSNPDLWKGSSMATMATQRVLVSEI